VGGGYIRRGGGLELEGEVLDPAGVTGHGPAIDDTINAECGRLSISP